MTGVIQRLWVRVPPESHFAAGPRRSLPGSRGRPRALPPRRVRPAPGERRGGGRHVLGASRAPGKNPALPGSVPGHPSRYFRGCCYRIAARAWWSCLLPTANISSPKKAFSRGWCLPSPNHPPLPLPPSFRRLPKRWLQEQEPQTLLLDPAEQMPFKIT